MGVRGLFIADELQLQGRKDESLEKTLFLHRGTITRRFAPLATVHWTLASRRRLIGTRFAHFDIVANGDTCTAHYSLLTIFLHLTEKVKHVCDILTSDRLMSDVSSTLCLQRTECAPCSKLPSLISPLALPPKALPLLRVPLPLALGLP